MAIEFRCTSCGKLLRTQDDTAGKQAKCPGCATILKIPVPEPVAPPVVPAMPYAAPPAVEMPPLPSSPFAPPHADHLSQPSPPDSTNPYSAPSAYRPPAVSYLGGAPTEIVPTRITVGGVFSRAWDIYQAELGMCMLAIMTYSVLNVFMLVAVVILAIIIEDPTLVLAVQAVAFIAVWLEQIWLQNGLLAFFIHVARGGKPQFAHIFSGGRWLFASLLVTVLLTLMMLMILAVFAAPAVIVNEFANDGWAFLFTAIGSYILCLPVLAFVMLMFSLALPLIIDRGFGVSGIMEVLSLSKRITSGNKITLFLISLSGFFMILASQAICGILTLFTMSYMIMVFAVAYLSMTGQSLRPPASTMRPMALPPAIPPYPA